MNFVWQSTFEMDNKKIEDDIQSIRNAIERSTKFISLSGISGILAGIFALAAGMIWFFQIGEVPVVSKVFVADANKIAAVACLTLVFSISLAIYFATKKAKKTKHRIWNPASKGLLKSMSLPLLSGAALAIILFSKAEYEYIIGICLLFYGLALYAGGHYTFGDVKTLGIIQIILGLFAIAWPDLSWYLWMIGFGVLHVFYGSVMHFKYERRTI